MKFVDWGTISYSEALQRQLELVHLVSENEEQEQIIFCSHPPVVTLGRGTQVGDLQGWSGEIVEVQRGGRATYHGPSQVVAYPILDLNHRGRDLHKFMRTIENCVIETLKHFDVFGESWEGNTGVWISTQKNSEKRKIASIGIAVKKWISYHGVAINIDNDPSAFCGLKPCGFTTETMISLEELTSKKILHTDFKTIFSKCLSQI